MMRPRNRPVVSLLGESAILLDGGLNQHDSSQAVIWGLADRISKWEHVREVSIGINNLMVIFDPVLIDFDQFVAEAISAWETTAPTDRTGSVIEVPVSYGGESGEDLASVATATGLTMREVVDIHSGTEYVVQALGAHPGFPYLYGLDSRLAVPRRASPRMVVQEGSIVIAGKQAGIITCTSASGWHILGRSSVKFFDPSRNAPALFSPGDRVRFVNEGMAS